MNSYASTIACLASGTPRVKTAPIVVVVGVLVLGCGSGSPGPDVDGGTSSDGGASPDGAGVPVVNCGIHSTMGSCGPISDDCYCAGSTCANPSSGVYTCVFSCTNDAQCNFVALGVQYARCDHFSDGESFCSPATSTSPDAGGGGGGG